MLNWDGNKGILYAYKHALARPALTSENDKTIFESFNDYINNQIKEDFQYDFIPEINKILENAGGISINPEDIRVIDPEMKSYFPDESKLVQTKFRVPKTSGEPEWVTIMRIPSIGEDNIIRVGGEAFAFINIIEQEPSISYEVKSDEARLKLINGKQNINIISSSSGIKIELSDMKSNSGSSKKYDILSLIFALAKFEGFNTRDVYDDFSTYAITRQGEGSNLINLEQRMLNLVGSESNKASEYEGFLLPRLKLYNLDKFNRKVESYSNEKLRNQLNKLLSLDMALNRVLARDVYSVLNPGKLVAKTGQTVTTKMLNDFDVEGVYKVDVRIDPQIEGNFLADDVNVYTLHKGLKINDIVREAIPGITGMYLDRDYTYEEFVNGYPITFLAKTEIDKDMLDIIVNYGIDEIRIKRNRDVGAAYTYHFYEEIISNRQFKRPVNSTLQWCYLDANNNFVPNDGSYTTYDLTALLSYCIKLFSGRYLERVIDADKGFRKRLVTVSEQYHKAFRYACINGFRKAHKHMLDLYKTDKTAYMQADKVENRFYPLTVNFMVYLRDIVRCLEPIRGDNIHNPVAYVSACTKVNVFVKSKHAVADAQRDIAIGSYGKIDPYEVPQSQKLGVANHLCCNTRIADKDEILEDGTIINKGAMQTAYYGLVHKGDITKINTANKVWFTAEQEEQHIIADICSIDFDENNCAKNDKLVLCRVPGNKFNERSTFAYKQISEVEYVNCDAEQSLGWASATVPFISSNDAARAIFAVAQMKQGKGLINPEEPDILTSAWEQIPRLNNAFGFIAKKAGKVIEVGYNSNKSEYTLVLLYEDGTSDSLAYPVLLNSGISVTKFNVLVKEDDLFEAGDVLVSSNFVSENGIVTLGVNALVGYICDSWNYEDGAHISEALSSKLKSYRINVETIEGKPDTDFAFKLSSHIGTKYVLPNTQKVQLSYKTISGHSTIPQTLERTIKKAYGFYESQENIHSEGSQRAGKVTGINLNFVSVDKFGIGDKISNRHGNKGVISTVSPTADMPRLKNGMPLDLCLNPLGVGSRMNIGQIKELHSGLVAHVCGFKLSADAYNSISEHELTELLSLVYHLANSVDDGNEAFTAHSELFSQMKNGEAFKAFLRQRLGYIRRYAGCFEKDGTAYIELPTNDGKFTQVRVPVGYLYIYKLAQEVEEKYNVRGGQNSLSKYTRIAKAPTKGASKNGGQRFGTMEIDALCAYGVSDYIHELVNERCDNAIARSNFITDIFLPTDCTSRYKRPNGKAQRRAVTQFVYSMLALGIMMEPDENNPEFVPLSKWNSEECVAVSPRALNKAGTIAEKALNFEKRKGDAAKHFAGMSLDVVNADNISNDAGDETEKSISNDVDEKPMSLIEAVNRLDVSSNLKYALLKKKE